MVSGLIPAKMGMAAMKNGRAKRMPATTAQPVAMESSTIPSFVDDGPIRTDLHRVEGRASDF